MSGSQNGHQIFVACFENNCFSKNFSRDMTGGGNFLGSIGFGMNHGYILYMMLVKKILQPLFKRHGFLRKVMVFLVINYSGFYKNQAFFQTSR